jgi:hypothetical protein
VDPKLAKFLVKNGIGLAFTVLMGATYKFSKKVESKIDEHYAEPKPEQTN